MSGVLFLRLHVPYPSTASLGTTTIDTLTCNAHRSDQKILPVQRAASALGGVDLMAKRLLENGHRFGRQFVVFQPKYAYPMYVVTYQLPEKENNILRL